MMTEIFYYCTTELSSQSNNNNNADYLLRNITISQWCFTLNSNPVRQHFCQKKLKGTVQISFDNILID